ncbi:MAG: outer membrane protein assembly factor BamE [Neomegalonema sp.]|nr:outer membrane protein assembly factor BamE [Neomegalonema sp.]
MRLALSASMLMMITGLGLAACSPMRQTHGYSPRPGELESLSAGVDDRASVQRKLGQPSTIGSFDDADWYYISMKTETVAFYAPEVVEQQVVTVSFGEDGRVADIGRFGIEDGQVIDLVTRTTPTSGRKLTILQQIFANLGRFDGGSDLLENQLNKQ